RARARGDGAGGAGRAEGARPGRPGPAPRCAGPAPAARRERRGAGADPVTWSHWLREARSEQRIRAGQRVADVLRDARARREWTAAGGGGRRAADQRAVVL